MPAHPQPNRPARGRDTHPAPSPADAGPDPYYAALVAGVDPVDPLEELLAGRPAWHDHAACRGHDTAMFFPSRGESVEPARAVCDTCAVREPCLTDALDTGERYGIRGGTSERQRRQLRRDHRRTA